MRTSQQIQDGGRTPYWKSFLAISLRHIELSDYDEIWYADMQFDSKSRE